MADDTLTTKQAEAIIAAAPPAATSVPTPPAQTQMKASWIPPQNVLAGGLGSIVAYFIITAIGNLTGIDVTHIGSIFGIDVSAVISGAVGLAIATWVPPSVADIITRLNDTIVHIAQRDPESNVSYVIKPVVPPPGQSPVVIPPASKT